MSTTKPTITQKEVFDDLSSRFLVNPEVSSFERVFFELEQAYWFYEDFYVELYANVPRITNLKKFCHNFFLSCPLLRPYSSQFEQLFSRFSEYYGQIPVYGGILLNPSMTKCLLVRAWKGSSWGFPKGKINENESDDKCAIREVHEEVGFDVSKLLHPNIFLQERVRNRAVKLFIVPNVPEEYAFLTHTRKEIGKIQWFSIDDLLADKSSKPFWSISPFIVRLKKWTQQNRHKFLTVSTNDTSNNKNNANDSNNNINGIVKSSKQLPNSNKAHLHPHQHKQVITRQKSPRPHPHHSRSYHSRSLSKKNQDYETFGIMKGQSRGWSAEEMFRENEIKFGVKSTIPTVESKVISGHVGNSIVVAKENSTNALSIKSSIFALFNSSLRVEASSSALGSDHNNNNSNLPSAKSTVFPRLPSNTNAATATKASAIPAASATSCNPLLEEFRFNQSEILHTLM